MKDRSNIIKEAIEYRDKLEKEVVRLRTIISKIKEIAEPIYEDYSKRWDDNISEGLEQIIELITKAESEG